MQDHGIVARSANQEAGQLVQCEAFMDNAVASSAACITYALGKLRDFFGRGSGTYNGSCSCLSQFGSARDSGVKPKKTDGSTVPSPLTDLHTYRQAAKSLCNPNLLGGVQLVGR